MPVTAHAENAYHPRQGAMSISRHHAVLDQPLTVGRFTRSKDDALCKPAKQFWGLYPGGGEDVTCPECLKRASRYGVTLVVPERPASPTATPVPSAPVEPGAFTPGSLMHALATWMADGDLKRA